MTTATDTEHDYPLSCARNVTIGAFAADGGPNCNPATTPKTCEPLWSSSPLAVSVLSTPTVANDILYVGADGGNLFAFDALGATGCNAQHVCLPLWRAPTGGPVKSSPSVANGRVFVGSQDGKLYAFDAAGNTGCVAGRQRICSPLWTATTANFVDSSPAVVNGVVYVGSDAGGSTAARLNVYDAAGSTNCSGTPRTCQPLWTSDALGIFGETPVSVANGVIYIEIATGIFSFVGSVHAFDASTPAAHCSGVPKVCTALWSVTPAGGDALGSAPSVADKFLYVGGMTLHAFAR